MYSKHLARVKRGVSLWAQTPHRVYLIIALIGVVGFALITPPFQGPDEESHYIRTQYAAHGYLLAVDAKKANAHLPASIPSTITDTRLNNADNGGLKKYNIRESYHAAKTPLNSEGSYQPAMISYTAVPYLPALPGVIIANSLNLSPIISFYVARLSLALFCVILTYFAIKIVPHKKYLFAAVALTPMLLFQQSVISTDGTSYALLLFFICYVLYLRKKRNITTEQWMIVGGLCLSITLAKPLVFLFLPLILVLSREKFAKIWIPSIAIVCMVILGAVTLHNSKQTDVVADPNVPKTANSVRQLENIEEHPKRFPRVMWNSYMTNYGDEETRGVIGIFGAADTEYPLGVTFLYIIMLAYLAAVRVKKEDEEESIPKVMKIMIVSLGFLYFVLVNVAIYLSFTPVNFDIVYGVQGRYFLPLLIVAPLFITPFLTIERKSYQKIIAYLTLSLSILVLVALFITLQRYYLYTP